MIYLDSAATTLQKPSAVARSTAKAVRTLSSPGRGGHASAMAAADAAFECRLSAAELFKVSDPEKIVFTQNATHALNIAIKSLAGRGDKVLISGYEHNAVTRPVYAIGAEAVIARSPLFEPEMMLHSFEQRLESGVSLVVCTHVSNVFGYILPVERIAQTCHERGVPFILDASQSAGALEIDAEKLHADYIAMPGHKGLYGPQGTGLLICSRVPDGIIQGGTGSNSISDKMPDFLPDRLEAGTHNMPGIAGLKTGIDFVKNIGTSKIRSHEESLTALAARLLSDIPDVRIFASEHGFSQAGVLSFIVRGIPCEEVGFMLGERGIAVRAGLHCAPTAHATAGTLETGTVRMSVSAFSRKRDIRALAAALRDIIQSKSNF